MGFVVAAVKVVAAAVAKSAIAKAVVKLAATAIVSKVASRSISKLLAKRTGANGPGGGEGGGRIQLPPATDNKLPVVFGSAWVNGTIIDAKISVDNKYMWYVLGFSDITTNSVMSYDTVNGVYYDGKKVTFGTNGAVASLTTNTTPAQVDTKIAGFLNIWLFTNGSFSGINTGGLSAIDIMSDSVTGGGIPANLRWNSALYTSGGQSASMNYVAFAIVRIAYNGDAGTTNLGTLQVKLTNNLGASYGARPGDAILEYMNDPWSGCNIPLEYIDTGSLTTLDTYSDQSIAYIDVNGNPQTQPYRYRVNGVLDTSNNVLDNLQMLVDACDSWLQYNEATGKWRVVPNAPYGGTLASLYNVNDDVLIGGIQINPIDLNYTYNQVEVAYPNTNIKDQSDYQLVDLTDPTTSWFSTFNSVLSPNEPLNRLNITLPMVNSAVQAKYIAVRRLLQSREDLVINFVLDYSGIQIDAGDVIRVNHNAYGWVDKLFRVSTVSEIQDESGNLMASIEAFEYNGSIYTAVDVSDYVPADNTGLVDPNVICVPGTPDIFPFTANDATVTGFTVRSWVPDCGTVLYMDFNYGTSSNVLTHALYKTVAASGGAPFTNSDSANAVYNYIYIDVQDLPASNYYWSATARNNTAGRLSNGSNAYSWGGANIQPWDGNSNTGGIGGNQVKSNTIVYRNFAAGLNVSQFIGGNNYAINLGNPQGNIAPVLLPVWANANTTRNVPLYIPPNTTWTANGTYPYYFGVSNTAAGNTGNNYYANNSTGAFTPVNASVLLIADGEDNWIMVAQDDIANGVLDEFTSVTNNTGFTIVSDTDNVKVQVVQGYTTASANYYQCDTNRMDTLELVKANYQYTWARTQTTYSPNGNTSINNVTGQATFIRNISNAANLTVTSGTIASSASGLLYY
jgi:hypothetical protein